MLSLLWLHPTSCRPCCQFRSTWLIPLIYQQVLLRLSTSARLTPQDLPSSLFQPTSGSCRLYNGRHAASNQVPAALITPPLHKVILPDDLAFRYFISDSFSFISRTLTCHLKMAFPWPFTTITLRRQQRRAVWLPRLNGAVDGSLVSP